MSQTIGLENPAGVINRFGVLPNGAAVETLIVGPISVPTSPPDQHHLTDMRVGVAKGSSITIFRFYRLPVGASNFVQVDEVPIGDYVSATITLDTAHRFFAGEQWKVTVQQSIVGRVSCTVKGQAKWADSRD